MDRLGITAMEVDESIEIHSLIDHWLRLWRLLILFIELQSSIVMNNNVSVEVRYFNDFLARRAHLNTLVYESDETCIEQLRMNRNTFKALCTMLEVKGGLRDTKHMLVDEQVAMFVHILAHHVKNRVIKFRFQRSGETISRYFRHVLDSIMLVQKDLMKIPEPIPTDCTDERWKWFKVLLVYFTLIYIVNSYLKIKL